MYICIFGIANVVAFRSKNVDVKKIQEVSRVIYIFSGSSLGKV